MTFNFLQKHPLYKECLEALNTQMLTDHESDVISELFKKIYPITKWGKIDWDKISQKINIGYDPKNIIPALTQLLGGKIEKCVYIEWSDGPQPVIKTDLDKVIEYFDYVTCISFDKFIFNPDQGYIIEVLPGDKMTVGIVNIDIIK